MHHNGNNIKLDNDIIQQQHSPMMTSSVKMEVTSSRGQLINPLTAINKDITHDYVTREMAEKGKNN